MGLFKTLFGGALKKAKRKSRSSKKKAKDKVSSWFAPKVSRTKVATGKTLGGRP